MAEESSHPIATPKGASAVTLLLGAVSVFAPFLVDLRTALLFGAAAILLIGWIYWSEVQIAWSNRSWNTYLNVPFGAATVIVLMAFVAMRNVAHAPRPVPAVRAEDVAEKVEGWLLHHQSQLSQGVPQQPVSVSRDKPEVTTLSPPKTYRKLPVSAESAPAANANWERTFKSIEESTARYKALSQCHEATWPVTIGLSKLINQAANYQNGWAYSRDGDLVRRQYEAWVGAVREFIAEHRDALGKTEEFDQAKELDMGPTLFVIPNSGVNAWINFDERRKALTNIETEFDKTACKTQEDAVNTFNNESDPSR